MEADEAVAALGLLLDRRRQQAVAERKLSAGRELPAGLDTALPEAVALVRQQKHLCRATGRHAMA